MKTGGDYEELLIDETGNLALSQSRNKGPRPIWTQGGNGQRRNKVNIREHQLRVFSNIGLSRDDSNPTALSSLKRTNEKHPTNESTNSTVLVEPAKSRLQYDFKLEKASNTMTH